MDCRPRPRLRAGLLALAALGPLLLGGCVYRMAVQQGNYLDAKQIEQLQTGMTRAQVRFVLGTPMLPEAFSRDRWDYVYYLKIGRLKQPQQRRLSVYFEEDKVERIERSGFDGTQAAAPAPDPAQAAPSAPGVDPLPAGTSPSAPSDSPSAAPPSG